MGEEKGKAKKEKEMGEEQGKAKKEKERRVRTKAKLAEDIIKAVKNEKFGFPDEQLRPAVNSLIETYGIDDAYKWITKDNYAVLVNFLLESPCKATDVSSSPLPSGENVHRKYLKDQLTVRHSGNATELRPMHVAKDASEQTCLRSTPLLSNESQNKHPRDRQLTDGSSKPKRMKLYRDCDVRPNSDLIHKKTLEQSSDVSPSVAVKGELNGSSLRENKLLPVPSASSSAMSREKECYSSKKVSHSRQTHESVARLNGNASVDMERTYQERQGDLKTSISYSNTASSKEYNGIGPRHLMVPSVKEEELSRHKLMHDKDHVLEKQISPIHMGEKHYSAMNLTNVNEDIKVHSRDSRNSSHGRTEEFKKTFKERSVGKGGHQDEVGKNHRICHDNNKKSVDDRTHSTEEFRYKNSKEHCMRKVKNHNDPALPLIKRESFKYKSVNTEGLTAKTEISFIVVDGEQKNVNNCKNGNDETRSKERGKPVSKKRSTEFASSSKQDHVGKKEDIGEEGLLPNRKINNIMPTAGSKPNKKNAILPENLSFQEIHNGSGRLSIRDPRDGQKQMIKVKVSGQPCSPFMRELKIVASGWVRTANGWLKTDISQEAVDFFLEWKKSLESRKEKVVLHSNDNNQDHCLHEQGTSKTGDVARVRRKKAISLSDKEGGDGVLLSLDISRGLEKKKITCVNQYDDTFFPEDFVYITKSLITADAHVDLSLSRIGDMRCSCSGDCLTSTMPCKCTDDTRGEYAYDKDGLLIPRLATNFCFQDGKMSRADFITECTPICPCDLQCGNRVVQRGLKYRLQVFMTKEGKGWGVRTLEHIVARSFLFEYIGEIMTNTEQYYRNEEYKGKNIHTYQMLLDADYDMETRHFKDGLNDDEALTLDATRYGNVSRFVNHRCGDPNMLIRPVQIDTRDTHYYHVAFFAAHDIGEMEELTWDYGINFDDKHEVKGFHCLCGSSLCRDSKNKACQKV